MKRGALALVGAILVTASPALAADWPLISGTEDGRPERAVQPFGVVQTTTDVSVDGEAPTTFQVRRARPGLRGSIPGTNRRVGYILLGELGTSGIGRKGPALVDASLTFSYVPGARIRVGQMKLPTLDEGEESNPVAAEWITPSLVASQVVTENVVEKGAFVGGANGYRDVGVKVFDGWQWGHAAVSYEAMVGNGRPNAIEADRPKDLAGRSTFTWVFSGARSDPHRQELSLFAWAQGGDRTVDGARTTRLRSGAGAHLELDPLRIRVEVVRGTGAIFLGPDASLPGKPLQVALHGEALGGYAQARFRILAPLLAGVRGEVLHLDSGTKTKTTRGLSPMVEVDLARTVRLQTTWASLWTDGTRDDRIAVQAEAWF